MLVERDGSLAVLAAALDDARAGRGRLVFVGGEAGVGKTSLVRAASERAAADIRLRRGVVDNITTPVATLDLLRFVGRRLDGLQLLVLATYRSEEVSARHPLAVVLGDLATADGVSRLDIEPLSVEAVGDLVVAAGSTLDPARLRERTNGNAFYVTETLAAPHEGLPPTVRDAVLSRVSRQSAPARAVLAAAAVLGRPAEAQLLAVIAEQDTTAVDVCVEHGLLVGDGTGWAFRHELARVAVEQTLGPGEIEALNRRAFAALLARGSDDDRRLAHHAMEGGQRATAGRHAVRAAQRAARLGAHRQAAEQYRLALRCSDRGSPDREELLVALSYECYLTDELDEALTARLRAMELAEVAGAVEGLGRHQRWVSRLLWFLGRGTESESYARRAVATLEPGGDGHELAMAYSNVAQLCMLASDVDATLQWGERALEIARRTGDREVEVHALNNVGTASLQRADSPDGRAPLRRSLDLALADDMHEHAARAYTNLGSIAVANRRLADADEVLLAGVAYCADRDLDSWRLYMSAHLARSLAEQGRYDEAADRVAEVLRQSRLAPISEIVAATVAGQLAARRGDVTSELLDRAWTLARTTGESQRIVLVASALAERDWITGRSRAGEALDVAWAAAQTRSTAWEIGELAYWRDVFGMPSDRSAGTATPFASMIRTQWSAAAQAWRGHNCPLWRAHALAHDPASESGREALAIVTDLDLPAYRDAVLRLRHESGLHVPRGPRAARRTNPASLTARELEVLQLLADGQSNADIATHLFLSEKTVGHHVSAVLRKVGEPTRARAAAWAIRRGLAGDRLRGSGPQT